MHDARKQIKRREPRPWHRRLGVQDELSAGRQWRVVIVDVVGVAMMGTECLDPPLDSQMIEREELRQLRNAVHRRTHNPEQYVLSPAVFVA